MDTVGLMNTNILITIILSVFMPAYQQSGDHAQL